MSELPFFVYGTLRPGEYNHDRFLRGRTATEEPALLAGALLYDGPGYPYLLRGAGCVTGDLVSAAPGHYEELVALLDLLEDGYDREVCDAVRTGDGATVRAWVYVATPAVRPGAAITGGDWLGHRPPPRRPGRPGSPLPQPRSGPPLPRTRPGSPLPGGPRTP
ncbi:gamma-glutamylcyclotransferase [Streptomyces ficellus]|uniref:Gamma-glutamylcyclotransferase n=1 Tax=Streptomyces ficellus TaxID=1977088 RepID=A0A6I6FCF9_9ACTN|nr:gamma-glutamylcyclotransferase [Streptomyces ficellus]